MPPRFHLPSGAQVELGVGEPIELDGPIGAELRALRVRLSVPLDALPLGDLHVLRAIARRLGLVDEPELAIRCSNCHGEFRVKPCSTLELGPFRDAELDDPEVDADFDFSRTHSIPAVRDDRDESRVRLAPCSVGQARELHRALSRDRPLRVTSRVVRGMGIVELDGETDPRRIARLLAAASDDCFDAVGALFEDAHYPPRLDVPHACPSCGLSEWLSVPLSRELSLEPSDDAAPPPPPDDRSFMDLDEFEALVREEAASAYADLGVREIDLAVIEGPAEVDDGGEPLLGCYRPPDPEGLVPRPAEIRLFYRTFANIAHDEGAYDVRAEVRETIRHELEHHFGHLSGDDPLDDEEHAEIQREHARRVGQRELERRAVRSFWSELRTFFARTWLVWLIALSVTLLAVLAESR